MAINADYLFNYDY